MPKDLYSMTTDELRSLAKQNSADWHGADADARDALHQQNVAINKILDARTGSSSSFDSGTGRWTVEQGTPSAEALAGEYRRVASARGDAYESQRRAQEAAVRKAVNALEGSRADTQAQYSDLFRQLYLDKMRSRKNMDQRFAASGITGGAAETVRLGYDTAYEDALRHGEQSRISAVNTIDRAIADARLTGDIEGANAAAKAMKEQTDAYADALKYLISRQDALDAQREKYEREDAALARRLAEQQREAEEQAAKEAEKEAEKALVPRLTYAQVLKEMERNPTPDIRAMYRYYRTYGG